MYTGFSHTLAGRKRNLCVRRSNEDRVLVRRFESPDHSPAILAAVADGVSNCADGGAVAHWLLHERLSQDPLPTETGTDLCRLIGTYLRHVHQDFLNRFASEPDLIESACTLAGVLARGTKACVFWCGDSPIHHLRKTSADHEGEMLTTPDKIEGTPMLTDCFSGVTAFAFRTRSIDVAPGDLIICATDGLVLDARELAESVNQYGFCSAWIEHICAHSHAFPGSDDVGVAAIRID